MMKILIIIGFWVVYLLGLFIGWYVPERLVKPWGMFDMFPFKCRKCMTFWSLLALFSTYALITSSWWVVLGGVIMIVLTTIALYIDEKSRTVE